MHVADGGKLNDGARGGEEPYFHGRFNIMGVKKNPTATLKSRKAVAQKVAAMTPSHAGRIFDSTL